MDTKRSPSTTARTARSKAKISARPNVRFYKKGLGIPYSSKKGVEDFVSRIYGATPSELVFTEKRGVEGVFLKDVSKSMAIPAKRVFEMLGVPKATAEKKALGGSLIGGSGGHSALGLVKLLGLANSIVKQSTAAEAVNFDTQKWLGKWLERPQAALGGKKPAEFLDTPTGLEIVTRLLGSLESGSYQ